jgi:hypothetical protein
MNETPAYPKRILLTGIAILALILCAMVAWWHWRTPLGKPEIASFLDRTEDNGRFRFTVDRVAAQRQDDGSLQLSVVATARTQQPLYSRIDTADYLRRTFQIEPESVADARSAIANKGAPLGPEVAAAGPIPSDPYRAILLRLNSPAGVPFPFHGVLGAHRSGDAWVFSLLSGSFDGAGPEGDIRTSFGEAALLPGDPGDDGRLRSMAAGLQAFADRLAGVHRKLESARVEAIAGRRMAFLGQIAPGRVFRGEALERGEQHGTVLYLEITDLSGEGEVTALLRNEGGWRNARAFQGNWSADDEFKAPVLNLTSLPDQAVRNAGPFLENTQTWTFALRMDPRSELSERNDRFQYQFQPLNPAQLAAAITRLDAEVNRAMAATEPGMLYGGEAASRSSGASTPILLRFTGRSESGQGIEARMESATHSWRRPLHGSIVENSRRSGGEPVRLQSAPGEAAAVAPADSPLGGTDGLDISLGIEEGSLVGEDALFTYRLAPVDESDLRRIEAEHRARARQFAAVFRSGIEFDGTLREEQGFVARARLDIVRVDPQTGAIAARISSLVKANVHRDFAGTCDPSVGEAMLGATGNGVFDKSGDFEIPFFVGPTAATLHLALSGRSIAGNIEGDTRWVMDFPTAAFSGAPTEAAEGPADYSMFPPFPREAGAYLLARGAWVPLPTNNGRVVTETIRPKTEVELPSNIADALNKGIEQVVKKSHKIKVSYLEFDGINPVPASKGPVIVLALVGPDITERMTVELAPAETLKEGPRRVEIQGSSPEKMRVSYERLPEYVRRAAPGVVLVTTTSEVAPGSYILNAGVGYELKQE